MSNAASWASRRNPLVQATYRYWRGKHVVYRYLGGGELLYVGMTFDLYERMKAHRRLSPWWPDMDRLVIKVYPSRVAARRAEIEAIRTEFPVYNAPERSTA